MSVGTNIQTVNFNNIQPKVQTNFKAQSSPVKDYPPDTVEINGKKKTGMSGGAKVGIGLGILGTAALAIGLIMKGRGSQAKEVVRHIDFKEAKTIEEAKKFAKDKLSIEWNGKLKEKDLDLINYVNDWVCRGINKNKFSIAKPNIAGSIEGTGVDGMFCALKNGNENIIGINTDKILKIAEQLANYNPVESKIYRLDNNNLIAIKDTTYDIPFVNEFVNKLNQYRKNPNSYSITDKLKLLTDWKIIESSPIVDGKLNPRKMSIDNWLNHEYGHLLHETIEKNYLQMCKPSEYIDCPVSNITKEFVENKDMQRIARSVTTYAAESPREFVAEVYAGMCDGIKFDDDVMALYKKYNGPMI